MSDDLINKDRVRAVVFAVGTQGKRYYTRCWEAQVGDLVEARGWSGPATVVGYGHPRSVLPPSSHARIVKRAEERRGPISALLPSDWAAATNITHNTKENDMPYASPDHSPTTPLEVAEARQAEAAAEIKRLKKADKRMKKLAAEAEAAVVQRRQRRELALTVLENIAADELASDGSRIEAAVQLHAMA